MPWLISLMLAGMMVSSQIGFAGYPVDNLYNPNVAPVVVAAQIVALDETERFEQTYPLSANGRVGVSNVNGSITIEAWDKNEVKLEAVKVADSRENLGNVRIKIDAKADYLKVETDYDSRQNGMGGQWRNRKLEVQYHLWVPRNAVLDQIETVNGEINVSNVTNMTKISTVNGEIRATNLRGTSSIETVNGTINADFESLQNVSQISLEAVNGTTNLVIPSDSEATIKAETVNGSINNDFGLPVRKGKYVGRDMYGRIGSGTVKIDLQTVNGTSSVRRRQDGKSIKSMTNLLPAKSDGDDDASNVNPRVKVNIDNAQINRDVSRAMKDSQKEMLRAQKELQKAQKDLDALSPEIQRATNEAIEQSMAAVGQALNAKTQLRIAESARVGMSLGLKQNRIFLRGAYLPTIEKKTETFNVKGKPKVTVNAKDCKIFVRGWDKPEVSYTVSKRSNSAGGQSNLQITARQNNSNINLDVAGSQTEEADEIRVEVFVPKKSDLRILTEREIRVEGVSGDVDLKGSSEVINVRDVDGTLAVATDDGAIRVIGFKGEITAQTVAGMMSLDGDFQKITADAGDGTILLTLPDGTNATFDADVEITAQGFNLVRDTTLENLWRLGKGGANYNLHSEKQIVIRNANQLVAAN